MPEQEPKPALREGARRIRLDGLPAPLRWAIWLLAAESAGLVAVVAILFYDDLAAPVQSVVSAVALTVAAALLAAILAGLAWALTRKRAWARGPAIVLQLLLLPIGYTMITGGLPVLGVPVIVIGLVGAGTLLAPATRAALGME